VQNGKYYRHNMHTILRPALLSTSMYPIVPPGQKRWGTCTRVPRGGAVPVRPSLYYVM